MLAPMATQEQANELRNCIVKLAEKSRRIQLQSCHNILDAAFAFVDALDAAEDHPPARLSIHGLNKHSDRGDVFGYDQLVRPKWTTQVREALANSALAGDNTRPLPVALDHVHIGSTGTMLRLTALVESPRLLNNRLIHPDQLDPETINDFLTESILPCFRNRRVTFLDVTRQMHAAVHPFRSLDPEFEHAFSVELDSLTPPPLMGSPTRPAIWQPAAQTIAHTPGGISPVQELGAKTLETVFPLVPGARLAAISRPMPRIGHRKPSGADVVERTLELQAQLETLIAMPELGDVRAYEYFAPRNNSSRAIENLALALAIVDLAGLDRIRN